MYNTLTMQELEHIRTEPRLISFFSFLQYHRNLVTVICASKIPVLYFPKRKQMKAKTRQPTEKLTVWTEAGFGTENLLPTKVTQ